MIARELICRIPCAAPITADQGGAERLRPTADGKTPELRVTLSSGCPSEHTKPDMGTQCLVQTTRTIPLGHPREWNGADGQGSGLNRTAA